MEMANITYQDEAGAVKVRIDNEKCITCGRCILACKHEARYYVDDTERFFEDLKNGIPISLVAAPSVRTNIPGYKKLFTYLKRMGVKKIYDVAMGADICIWAHIRYMEKDGVVPLITQPCPAVVSYCEIYNHALLKRLSPVHSPMACTSIYLKKYMGVKDRIAAISPCIAKSNEFEATLLAQYNITFVKLLEYLEKNNITLPEEKSEFDNDESGLGSLFPIPGGLKENIEYFTEKKFHIARADGFDVYNKLNKYAESPEDFLPDVLDVLNCSEGCNMGPASSPGRNVFEIDKIMHSKRKRTTEGRKREHYEAVYKTYDDTFNLADFTRKYKPVAGVFPAITNADIGKAFEQLDKENYEEQNVDCGACGSRTCYNMARKIALGVNIPDNCMINTVKTAREEHETNLNILTQFETVWNNVESGIMLVDAETREIININPAAVRIMGEEKENIIGQPCFKFFGQHECPVLDTDQKVDRSEQQFTRLDGTVIPIIKSTTKTLYKGRQVLLESFNDISHIKDVENQKHLLELGERVQLMLASNPQINILFDSNFKVIDCNPAAIKLMGFESKEDLFARFVEHINEHTPEFMTGGKRSVSITDGLTAAVTTGHAEFEAELHINGVIHNYDVEMRTIPYEESFAIVVYVVDITGIRQHENELMRAHELNELQLVTMELMIKATGIALWDVNVVKNDPVNPENIIVWTNEFRRMLGFKDDSDFPNLFKSWIDRLHQEDKERVLGAFVSHVLDKTGKIPFNIEYRIMKKDGEYGYFHTSGESIRDDTGSPVRVAGSLMDVTETKNTMIKNELQLAKLNLVVKATGIGLWDMDIVKDDPVNLENAFKWSDELRHMLGFTDEKDFPNIFRSLIDCLHPDERKGAVDAFEKHITDTTGKTPFDVEHRVRKKTGDYIYLRASGETIRDKDGNPIRTAGAMLDTTETRKLIQEAEDQRIAAETASRAKSSFLSTMSHEIRTPMNAILGITEIQIQNESLDHDVRDALEKIYASGDLLLGIINDILDLSKIEAGKMDLDPSRYEISSLISDTAQLNMMRIGSKPIEFELSVDENTPVSLFGDELRVKQILNNLLSNAFKYTHAGTVKMSVFAEPIKGKDDKIALVVSISDTGQGMTQEQLSRLFNEYARFNTEANRATEGTGLGMNITRNLVNLMEGEISVESEFGKGSTFTVRLPQGREGPEVLGREMSENLHNFRTSERAHMRRVQISREPMPYGKVLIVDDVETNIYVARGLMTPYGLKIESAGSGITAIEKVKAGSEYDIIFMDHMMPGMDGMEATKVLREMGYSRSIVALTANAVAGQADMFLKNGFDDYISKPIDIRQLNTVLNKLIRDKQPIEVIETARKNANANAGQSAGNALSQSAVKERTIEFFLHDAVKAISVLEEIAGKNNYADKDTLRTYVITVHGIKGALANIGKKELSAAALKLETAGRGGKLDVLSSQTSSFLDSLKAVVKELKPAEETASGEVNEDKEYLSKMLLAIKAACEEYDEDASDKALSELRKKPLQKESEELLSDIAEQLLHSDFDEVIKTIDKFMKQ